MFASSVRALFAASALFVLSACEQPCPSQPTACATSATLRFALPAGVPEAYEVRVRVRESGVDHDDRCLLIAPLPSDWPSRSFTASCAANLVSLTIRPIIEADCDPQVTPTPDGVEIGASCETRADSSELVLVRAGNPELVEIELSRGGEGFAPLAVTPVYADTFPDGEHCSARCAQSSEQRSFDELTQPVQTR